MVLYDGPRNKLGEKGNIKSQIKRIFLDANILPVHIDHIGQRLKRVKGNSDGERNLPQADPPVSHYIIENLRQEIKIFKISQKPHI